jgi:hypothetical protein
VPEELPEELLFDESLLPVSGELSVPEASVTEAPEEPPLLEELVPDELLPLLEVLAPEEDTPDEPLLLVEAREEPPLLEDELPVRPPSPPPSRALPDELVPPAPSADEPPVVLSRPPSAAGNPLSPPPHATASATNGATTRDLRQTDKGSPLPGLKCARPPFQDQTGARFFGAMYLTPRESTRQRPPPRGPRVRDE